MPAEATEPCRKHHCVGVLIELPHMLQLMRQACQVVRLDGLHSVHMLCKDVINRIKPG